MQVWATQTETTKSHINLADIWGPQEANIHWAAGEGPPAREGGGGGGGDGGGEPRGRGPGGGHAMGVTSSSDNPWHVHWRLHEDQGVPHTVGTVLQPQPLVEHDGSTLLLMHAFSHLLQRATNGNMGVDYKLWHHRSGSKTQCHHPQWKTLALSHQVIQKTIRQHTGTRTSRRYPPKRNSYERQRPGWIHHEIRSPSGRSWVWLK